MSPAHSRRPFEALPGGVIDDALVERAVARWLLVRLQLGPTPVDDRALEQLRARIARRRSTR